MLNGGQVPVQMRQLLKLTITPLAYLHEMDHSCQLPYELLEELSPGMIRSLRLLMVQPAMFDPTQPLLYRFFNLTAAFHSLLCLHSSFLNEWNTFTVASTEDDNPKEKQTFLSQ